MKVPSGTRPCPGCSGSAVDVTGDECALCDGSGHLPPPCRAQCGELASFDGWYCSYQCQRFDAVRAARRRAR